MNAQLKIEPAELATATVAQTLCFHCNEPIPSGTHIFARIKQHDAAMCCEGCRAVAELIASAGLQDYYTYRNEPALKPNQGVDQWSLYAQPAVANQYVRAESIGKHSAVILVDGIRCAACAWLIDRMLRRDQRICNVNVNLATTHVLVEWQGDSVFFATVLRMLSSLGYKPHALDAQGIQQQSEDERRNLLKRLGVSGVGMMQVMMYVLPMYVHNDMDATVRHYLQLIGLLLTTPVLFYAGWPFLESSIRALRMRAINMDVPVAIALVLAYGASVINTLLQKGDTYFDSVCMFIFLLTLARFVVRSVQHRSHSVTDALVRIQPRIAHRLHDGILEDVAVNQLIIDDVVQVRAGEAFPVDGIIVNGTSTIDESLLTGESLPVSRAVGETVMAGSINIAAMVEVCVTQLGQQTILANVVALLERVQATKPRSVLLADHISRWFLQAMLLLTAMVAVYWWVADPSRIFNTVLAVLVVTCPCALSLAAPAVIAATTTALTRRGLLITHANAIEELSAVGLMVFDKTGTLTVGKVSLANTTTLGKLSADHCLQLAATLEQAAEHPIARAFDTKQTLLRVEQLMLVPGRGVEGTVDGVRYRLGNPSFVNKLNGQLLIRQDRHAVWLGDERSLLACFELRDELRSDAANVIEDLRRVQVDSVILSGDALSCVERVAHQCTITNYYARQSPDDKVQILKQYQRQSRVAMVGDGINDAPVLSAATVSIAMGAGTSMAKASADAVLMNNSLMVLPQAIRVARRAKNIMRQNLCWAAVYNLSAVPLAAMGYINPWMAAAGMSVSSVLVVLNATRVLHMKTS